MTTDKDIISSIWAKTFFITPRTFPKLKLHSYFWILNIQKYLCHSTLKHLPELGSDLFAKTIQIHMSVQISNVELKVMAFKINFL